MSRSTALAAVTAVTAIVLAGCSGSGADTGGYYGAGGPTAKLSPPKGTTLTSNSTAQFGTVVIDAVGFTLYRFDGDSAQPSKTTCDGECATSWPPVISTDPITLEGVDKEDVGTVTRPDGTEQVTISGWPIYRYAADSAPGAVDGQGKSGKWFAITPTGKKAKEATS